MAEQDRIGTCRLCGQSKPLCNSHIVPEFCYGRAYDAQHRVLDMDLRGRNRHPVRYIQKGYREPLLCRDCETRISRYEDRFAKFWYGSSGLPDTIDMRCRFLVLSGVDCVSFRLFHLSVLWRAAVSRLCASVELGPYEAKLREVVRSGFLPQQEHFPVLGQVLVDETGTVMHGLVTSPCPYESPPSTAYRACYAGCEWHVVVTDHPTEDQRTLINEFGRQGRVVLMCTDWRHTGTAKALADAYRRRKK